MFNWSRNLFKEIKGNPTLKSKIIVMLFRLSSIYFNKTKNPMKYLFIVFVILYYAFVEMLWGIEIKPKTVIGWGLRIFHPTTIIINPGSIIGKDLFLRHGVTIGNKFDKLSGTETKCPILGNNVELGAHSTILGNVCIGDNVLIGSMAFVDFDVESDSVIAASRGIKLRKK